MTPDLCLGTAQFGLSYGVVNAEGKVSESIVNEILREASLVGIRKLDTARVYGNAEEVLGRVLRKDDKFEITTKLPKQTKNTFSKEDVEKWEEEFSKSCEKLNREGVHTYLLHGTEDLKKPGAEHLECWLLRLKEQGRAKRIGVSIYNSDDLSGVRHEVLDVVQLPLSLYDQRCLLDGTISRLRKRGTAIYARSIYLQGLLLTSAATWPEWAAEDAKRHHERLLAFASENGYSLIELALGFIKQQKDLEGAVVGICSTEELQDLIAAWKKEVPSKIGQWRTWPLYNDDMIDPRKWPQRVMP